MTTSESDYTTLEWVLAGVIIAVLLLAAAFA